MSEKCRELVSPQTGGCILTRAGAVKTDRGETKWLPLVCHPAPSGQRADFALGWQFSTKGNFAHPPYSPAGTWQYLKTFLAVTRGGEGVCVLQRPRKLRNPLPCAGANLARWVCTPAGVPVSSVLGQLANASRPSLCLAQLGQPDVFFLQFASGAE